MLIFIKHIIVIGTKIYNIHTYHYGVTTKQIKPQKINHSANACKQFKFLCYNRF